MKTRFLFICFLVLPFALINAQSEVSPLGKKINDFSLQNTNHEWISLSQFKDAKGFIIVFTCNHCPMAKLYTQRFNEMFAEYSKLGVPLIAINSMDTAVYEEEQFVTMQKKAKKEKFLFPYLHDTKQSVGLSFGAPHTPHAYVIWKENDEWIIRYSGGFDDNAQHPEVATPFVKNAVNDLLSGKKIALPETESFGCKIYYREK